MGAGRKALKAVQVGDTFYAAGDTVPADVVDLITNPKVFGSEPVAAEKSTKAPEAKGGTSGKSDGDKAPADPPKGGEGGDSGQESGPTEPPRAGAGASLDAWASHAKELGLEVPAEAKRDDVIALVDLHNAASGD